MPHRVVSLSIHRRCIAATLFSGTELIHTEVCNLSSDRLKALAALNRVVRELLALYPAKQVVLEAEHNLSDTRRGELYRATRALLEELKIDVVNVGKALLLSAFSHPPVRTRVSLHAIISHLWPGLYPRFRTSAVLDAAALGAYAQLQLALDQ